MKQDKVTYNHAKIVNIYTVYEINKNHNINNFPTQENSLEQLVWLKMLIMVKYKYSGYGNGFDRHGLFSHPNGGIGRNEIFGVVWVHLQRLITGRNIF